MLFRSVYVASEPEGPAVREGHRKRCRTTESVFGRHRCGVLGGPGVGVLRQEVLELGIHAGADNGPEQRVGGLATCIGAGAFLDQDLGEPLVVSHRPGPAGPGQRVVFESFADEALQAPVDDRASDEGRQVDAAAKSFKNIRVDGT